MKFLEAAIIAVVLLGAGCGPSGTLIDRNLTEIQLKNIRLTPQPRLRIIHGEAMRDIPIKAVQTLEVYPEDYVNREGEVFYSCRLVLKSGEAIVPRAEKNRLSKTYVCVSSFITAGGREGSVRISIDNIKKITVR